MMWTNRKPWIATEDDCKRPWNGGKNGKYFRCALCGHKFKPGDTVRWEMTNMGNPFICKACDGTREEIIEKMIACREQAKKLWYFIPHND